jgi:hypothetical protein
VQYAIKLEKRRDAGNLRKEHHVSGRRSSSSSSSSSGTTTTNPSSSTTTTNRQQTSIADVLLRSHAAGDMRADQDQC